MVATLLCLRPGCYSATQVRNYNGSKAGEPASHGRAIPASPPAAADRHVGLGDRGQSVHQRLSTVKPVRLGLRLGVRAPSTKYVAFARRLQARPAAAKCADGPESFAGEVEPRIQVGAWWSGSVL